LHIHISYSILPYEVCNPLNCQPGHSVIAMSEAESVWLDVTVIRCPHCGKLYVDATWYVLGLESDIDCSVCGRTFNTRKNAVARALLKITVEEGKIVHADVAQQLSIEEKPP